MASVGTDTLGHRALPRLSWGAVIAGVLLAIAAHIVLGLVGAALGFAAAPADSRGVGAAAAIWALVTPFVATLLGAWLACRMASEWDTAGSNLHGVMVWCIGLIAGAIFLTGTLASGAMTAGAAASGNAGMMQGLGGTTPSDMRGPRGQAQAEQAGKAAAATMGGAAMAALAGLLGAFVGAGIARSSREGKGLGMGLGGFKIVRTGQVRRGDGHAVATRPIEEERRYGEQRTYQPSAPERGSMETTREVTRTETPTSQPPDPYHH
ncbi:hypothetical protein [Anaeromyxobacter oryzae]|uniref:Uncharacterized protein n=1 Tax=Anaeromyxobacter oryzae TaxID=2918170 RepID=A0ABM7X301_9BACT|nr:hypothetical protein [Anaeromyxobacter oryzae]BDG06171.1 hypothetical protein AMOR_51670 [Anaeromyxobacter oryzae]